MKTRQASRVVSRCIASSFLALSLAACELWPPIGYEAEGTPWVRSLPEGRRTLYVSPRGTGPGSDEDWPMSLGEAVARARPGDRYWLLSGDYEGGYSLSASGTAADPIVYRAAPGARARVLGGLVITGEHNWVWGLEVTDPDDRYDGASISAEARGTVLVNNVLHDEGFDTSLASWNKPDQIVYGNVVYHGHHNIYTQNTADAGSRYFVHNVSLDAKPDSEGRNGPFEFHAYAEGGDVSGFYLRGNVFADSTRAGRMLIGGRNATANDRHVIVDNYFHRASLQLGYARPVQAVVTGNYLVDSQFSYEYFWGVGEIQFPDIPAIVVLDNELYMRNSEDRYVFVRSSAYTGYNPDGSYSRSDGIPPLRSQDSWDRNTYSPRFMGAIEAAGSRQGVLGLSAWGDATADRGNRFDASGREVPFPTGVKVALIPNDYEEGRANLIVYNFDGSGSVGVDLSSVIRAGQFYYVYAAKSAFSDPVAWGFYRGGTVGVPLDGEFGVFIVTTHGYE